MIKISPENNDDSSEFVGEYNGFVLVEKSDKMEKFIEKNITDVIGGDDENSNSEHGNSEENNNNINNKSVDKDEVEKNILINKSQQNGKQNQNNEIKKQSGTSRFLNFFKNLIIGDKDKKTNDKNDEEEKNISNIKKIDDDNKNINNNIINDSININNDNNNKINIINNNLSNDNNINNINNTVINKNIQINQINNINNNFIINNNNNYINQNFNNQFIFTGNSPSSLNSINLVNSYNSSNSFNSYDSTTFSSLQNSENYKENILYNSYNSYNNFNNNNDNMNNISNYNNNIFYNYHSPYKHNFKSSNNFNNNNNNKFTQSWYSQNSLRSSFNSSNSNISNNSYDKINNNKNNLIDSKYNISSLNSINVSNNISTDIDIKKVLSLEDQRTALMIKNIPNKFKKDLLINIINQNFSGCYDLFILPTDSNKSKNFGYGFINFISSYYIPYFYFMFNDNMWSETKSKKVCEIKYSTIQGKNKLIKHYEKKNVYFNEEGEKNNIKDNKQFIIPNTYKDIFLELYPHKINDILQFQYYFLTMMP